MQRDRRVLVDRRDESLLNAVGAVWSYEVTRVGTGYPAATGEAAASGFLIDSCHVLTSLHVVYPPEAAATAAPLSGRAVSFGVGQTASARDRGALQGLKFLYHGTVAGYGNARIVDGRVAAPDGDWAVIRLAIDVDASIEPLQLAAADAALPSGLRLAAAGYPSDHRTQLGLGFKLMDLWKSEGIAVAVLPAEGGGALLATTLQTTPGNSGGPIYAAIGGRAHAVIGIVQSTRGNGIDVTESAPNAHVLLTAATLARIDAARAQFPCRP